MTELEIRLCNRISSQRGALLDNYCATMRALEFIESTKKTHQKDRIVKNLKRVIQDTRKELLELSDHQESDENMKGRLGI